MNEDRTAGNGTPLARTLAMALLLALAATASPPLAAQSDPAEPFTGKPTPKLLPRPAGAVTREEINRAAMRELIEKLVSCGTRSSLSSWDDHARGVGCGRDKILARLSEISKASGDKLRVVKDAFETSSPRTNGGRVHMENIYAVLPGADAALAKTVFIVSGHFDSRASDVMNPSLDAPGADDDASGVAVSMECARLLSRDRADSHESNRATLLFAAVSGEEQGLLGSRRMLEWIREQGYTVGGMLDDDIVGADSSPAGPHRVRVFSGGGNLDDADSASRELARSVEEIAGRNHVHLIFNVDRLGRGGDHYVFYTAGLPAVRFTEPLEDYRHQHQTPRVEGGVEFGDQMKYLNFRFLGDVAWANAEALRQLALAPAPPKQVTLRGGVSPDARVLIAADDDPERTGFEILWRDTTDPRWSVYDFAPAAGEHVLKGVSTDNHFFGVRSVGKNGARSIAVPADADQRLLPF